MPKLLAASLIAILVGGGSVAAAAATGTTTGHGGDGAPRPYVMPDASAAEVLRRLFPDMVRPAGASSKRPTVANTSQQAQQLASSKLAAGAPKPAKPGKPVVSPVLASAAGAVALVPGLKSIPPSAEAQMSALMEMMRSPEEVVRNSELVTVPTALQAKLARIATAAMGGAKTVLPADVQVELERYLRGVAGRGRGKDILVPAGSTGMLFGSQVQALLSKSAGGGIGGASN